MWVSIICRTSHSSDVSIQQWSKHWDNSVRGDPKVLCDLIQGYFPFLQWSSKIKRTSNEVRGKNLMDSKSWHHKFFWLQKSNNLLHPGIFISLCCSLSLTITGINICWFCAIQTHNQKFFQLPRAFTVKKRGSLMVQEKVIQRWMSAIQVSVFGWDV